MRLRRIDYNSSPFKLSTAIKNPTKNCDLKSKVIERNYTISFEFEIKRMRV
jgi:hypothetical protein